MTDHRLTLSIRALVVALAMTIVSAGSAQAADYYAAPWGTAAGSGSFENPWDLATALNSNALGVHGGDTIWLRGGWYVGTYVSTLAGISNAQPIVVRQYPGERATIDRSGGEPYIDALYVIGTYTWYWGFEITDTDPRRTTLDTGSFPADLPRWNGIYTTAPNNKFINLVVHDVANGIAVFAADNTEIYGSIVYFNGWDAPDRGHGHGIYTQNVTGTRLVSDNIIFDQLSHGIHAWGSSAAFLNNIHLVGNTSFDNGRLTLMNRFYDRNLLLGGGSTAQSPVVNDNYTYYTPGISHSGGGNNNLGYAAGCTNLEARRNYFGNVINSPLVLINCPGAITDNTFAGPLGGGSALSAYTDSTFNNTFIPGRPTGTRVFVRANAYEPGRSNVTIFNWTSAATVNVNLSGTGLNVGDSFQIKDAQNFFGSPVVTGTYTGAPVTIPMTGLSMAAPIGTGLTVPTHTSAEFGAFVVMPGNSGTLIEYPHPPAKPLPYALAVNYLGLIRDAVGPNVRALVSDGVADGSFQIVPTGVPGSKTIRKIELKLAGNAGVWNASPDDYWALGVSATLTGSLMNAADASVNTTVAGNTSLYLFASDVLSSSIFTPGALFFVNVFFTDGTMAAGHTKISEEIGPPPDAPPSTTGNTATYIKTDISTQGDWKGKYGSDGHALAKDGTAYPAYAYVTFADQSSWAWNPSTTNTRALQKESSVLDRIAACWHSGGTFVIDLTILDGNPHEIALYSLDWDFQSRVQTIDLIDPVTGFLLDRRVVSSFANGVYTVWQVTGHVRIRVTKSGPNSSAVSAIFFDPSTTPPPTANVLPTVSMTGPIGGSFTAPATVPLSADADDSDGSVTEVMFYNGLTAIGAGVKNGTTYTLDWTLVPAGAYVISARATDNSTGVRSSTPIEVTVDPSNNVLPTVSIGSPAVGASFVAPAAVSLTADAADTDGSITQVAFYRGGTTLIGPGVWNGTTFALTWSSVTAGSYQVTAKATDDDGGTMVSAIREVVVSPPPNLPPTVNMTGPAVGASFVAPATVSLTASAGDSDGNVSSVGFYLGTTLIGAGTWNGTAYVYSWTNVAAGSYQVTAKATDNSGAAIVSTALAVTVSAPTPATAVFVTSDTTTQGNWKGTFGGQGYALANEGVSYPSYAQVVFSNQQSWTWSAGATQAQALQKAGSGRIAACWYSATSFTIDINITDGNQHQIALYALDWDGLGRSETIDVIDSASGVVLDSRSVSGFTGGAYRVWRISGHVVIRVTRTAGANATISGLFFDSAGAFVPTPTVTLTSPQSSAFLTAPATVALSADAFEAGGTIAQVAFYNGTSLIAASPNTASPFTLSWTDVPAGTYVLTAKATDGSGTTATSTPVTISVREPGGAAGTSATFVRIDSTTQGNWRNAYGLNGYVVATDSTSLPAYAQVAIAGHFQWTWAQGLYDPRALQKGGAANDRIAACWYGPAGFTIDVNLTDGAAHQIGLYGLDWDMNGGGRIEKVEVLDAVSGAVLDSRTFAGFQNGQYWFWRVTGHVTIRITPTVGNAVVSGLFFDAP